MNGKIGVWVDHQKAIVVKILDSGEETTAVYSSAESQLRRSSDRTDGSFEPQQVPADDKRERKHKAELNSFYDEIISHLSSTSGILVFGPGEAKKELRNRMVEKHGVTENVTVETADSMTDAQVVAKVRDHFQKH